METHKTSLIILILILIFAVIHSGGAALRIKAESIMGPRLWRLCFVFLSLPSAIILISYFLAHRYDGIRLWNLQGNNFVFMIVWFLTAISFLFLYDMFSTKNICFKIVYSLNCFYTIHTYKNSIRPRQ